jgi:hypothetical protein
LIGILLAIADAAKAEMAGLSTLDGILIGAISILFASGVALLKYIAILHKVYSKKIEELMYSRISDLQNASTKVTTAEDITLRQIGTRHRKKYGKDQDPDQEGGTYGSD